MTKGNLQYYFSSKSAMAQEIANRASPGDRHPLTICELSPGTRGLVEMVSAMANEYVDSPYTQASIRLSEEGNFRSDPSRSLHDEWIAVIEQLSEQGVRNGELDPKLDVPDFAIRFLGAFIGTRVVSLLLRELDRFPERARASAADMIEAHRHRPTTI